MCEIMEFPKCVDMDTHDKSKMRIVGCFEERKRAISNFPKIQKARGETIQTKCGKRNIRKLMVECVFPDVHFVGIKFYSAFIYRKWLLENVANRK